jgi:hypothetical protein
VGSPAYEEALNAIVKSQKEQIAGEEAAEAAKRASDAKLLAAQQAEVAKKENELLAATAPATRYRGAWFAGSSSKIIDMEFTDQQMDGRILRAKFTLPDDPTQVLEYEGYLLADNNKSDNAGPIRLHFVRGTAKRADWGIDWSNLFQLAAPSTFAQQDPTVLRDQLREIARPEETAPTLNTRSNGERSRYRYETKANEFRGRGALSQRSQTATVNSFNWRFLPRRNRSGDPATYRLQLIAA